MSISGTTCVAAKIKVIFLGDPAVGKTCLISAIRNETVPLQHETTIGIDFFSKIVQHNSCQVKLQFWDTAGQERFRSIIPSYVRNSQVGILVFDVCSQSSYDKLNYWVDTFRQNSNQDSRIVIVGNKIDKQERVVDQTEAMNKMKELELPYVETSAVSGEGMEELEQLIMNFSDKCSVDSEAKCKSYSNLQMENSLEEGRLEGREKGCCARS